MSPLVRAGPRHASPGGRVVSPLPTERRKGKRIEVRVPILLSSLTTDHALVDVEAEALSASITGLKLRSEQLLRAGMYVRLKRPGGQETKLARVVWAREEDSQAMAGLALGLHLRDPEDFWGVDFASSDQPDPYFWQEALQATPATPTAAAVEPAPAPPLEIAAGGAPVLVRGMSAARMPFQDETVLLPAGEQEGKVLIRCVVDDGRLVQVLFLEQGRVLKARTSGISRRRPDGKFRLWLTFDQPVIIVGEPPAEES
jgi:hypothetical protein